MNFDTIFEFLSYCDYSLGVSDRDTITRRENCVNKPLSRLDQGCENKYTTDFTPQVGDEESKEDIVPSKGEVLASTVVIEDATVAVREFGTVKVSDEIVVKDMTIVDFLSKPYRINEVTWTTASNANAQLITTAATNILLTASSIWNNKTSGFYLMRGVCCFKLMINANPFQQGRLLMHFLPNYSSYGTSTSWYATTHNANLVTKTQQPNVELDCRDGAAILKIPYVAPTNWCKNKNSLTDKDFFDWGTLFITVLEPLATGAAGTTSVDAVLYQWFEDFELAGPIVPQSGSKPRKKFSIKKVNREGKEVSEKPISTALEHTAKAADSLSSIPIISSVATTASWVLRTASGVASALGWSKPTLEDSPVIMSQQFNRYSATASGADVSFPLGILHDNGISPDDGNTIREEDEMSFAFLKKVSSYLGTLSWNAADTTGTLLLRKDWSPSICNKEESVTYNGHTATYRSGPPFYYLSNFFSYYRGSMKVIFKVIKTDFHSGRLQITWTPRGMNSVTSPDLTTGVYSLRWIIDIREGNFLEIELPWMLPTNYLHCNEPSGTLDVIVLNELRAPETAAQYVSILFYTSAGDDFELAGPGAVSYTGDNSGPYPFIPQSGQEVLKVGPIGAQPVEKFTLVPSTHSMGELFTSVRQLLLRNNAIQIVTRPANIHGWQVWPWMANAYSINHGTGALQTGLAGGDMYSVVAPMYQYYRGSMKVTLRQETPSSVNSAIAASVDCSIAEKVGTLLVVDNLNVNVILDANSALLPNMVNHGVGISNASIGVTSFSVPYYCPMKASLVQVQTTTANSIIPIDLSQAKTVLNLQGRSILASGLDAALCRSVADDFQFSYFIGCPPLLVNYV